MTLADTSAWVEYLRATGSPTHLRMRQLVRGRDVAVTDPVVMELLAGMRADRREGLRRALYSLEMLRVEGLADWEAAAEIYAACGRAGERPRSQLDCLIAAVAIREDVPLLHRDQDFDVIARHAPLRVDAG